MITLIPPSKNKDKLNRLLKFLEKILDICEHINVQPILDGSLAVLLYTKNNDITVNDIDLCYSKQYFPQIEKTLLEHGFKAEIKTWHVLQVRNDDLKIEFGDTDYWYPNVSVESGEILQVGTHTIGILKLKNLISFYRIGMKNLEKELPEKQDKYKDIKKKRELLERIIQD